MTTTPRTQLYLLKLDGEVTPSSIRKKFKTAGFEKPDLYVVPDFQGLPLSLGVGYLGMPGNSAYFGFLNICQPKANEVVVVTGAAGKFTFFLRV